ncbi:MAG: serine/threonine-protein kinase, partial [Gemmataceae bacterium]|nr:serine/threonine-protein kinase [Gemmataceae bacterium]
MSDTRRDDGAGHTQPPAPGERFQHALRAAPDGRVGDWEPFLLGLTGAARHTQLVELVTLDLAFQWSRGARPKVEDYLARFPELGPSDRVEKALVLAEFVARRAAGETPDPGEYEDRFPAQFPYIRADLQAGSGTVVSSDPPRWEPADSTLSVSQQYELVRELGRGMFGEVWLARKKPSGIEKAIKIMLEAADRDASLRELKSLELIKNLRHPYILAIEDFWVARNRLHIVMELAEGTLRKRLKDCLTAGEPGIPVEELFQYIAEAAEGLDFLHSQKVTHRDIKPDNILILHGHAKLADFGLARAQAQLVDAVSFAGTPAYMAPEIWRGECGPA